jgi:hypothetical protein
MDVKNWKLLTVVTDGQTLEIEGVDVWLGKWNKLDLGILTVPHPSYPAQRHELRIYYMESNDHPVVFAAGELSNGVWCFYVPSKGQPMHVSKGSNVNERLYAWDLVEEFEKAVQSKNEKKAVDLLIYSGLSLDQSRDTVHAILKDPGYYGY